MDSGGTTMPSHTVKTKRNRKNLCYLSQEEPQASTVQLPLFPFIYAAEAQRTLNSRRRK